MADLGKYFPIQEIKEGAMINGAGGITVGFGMVYPEIFTLNDQRYDDIHQRLLRVFSRLPYGTVIHSLNFYNTHKFQTNNTGVNEVLKENLRWYENRQMMQSVNYLLITFTNETLFRVTAQKNPFIKAKDYLWNQPFKDVAKTYQHFTSHISSLESSLEQVPGVLNWRLDNIGLKKVLYQYFALEMSDAIENVDDKFLPDIEVENGYVRLGDHFIKVISLQKESPVVTRSNASNFKGLRETGVKFPRDIELETSFSFPLGLGLPIPHILNAGFEILEEEQVEKQLKFQKNVGLQQLAFLGNQAAQDKCANIDGFIDDVSKHNYKPSRFALNVVLFDQDKSKLQEKTDLTLNQFGSMGDAQGMVENEETLNVFTASAPGNFKFNYRNFLQVADLSTCYLPKEANYQGDRAGVVLVDRMGNPITIDMWDNPRLDNRNGVIFAPSGGGKSVLANYLVSQFINLNHTVFVIDVGGSYYHNGLKHEAFYFDCQRENLQFNPFICPKDESGNFRYKDDEDPVEGPLQVNFILSVILKIWNRGKEVDNVVETTLKDLIKAFYEDVNKKGDFPDMKKFRDYVKEFAQNQASESQKKYVDFESLRLTLNPYADGEYRQLLNGSENFDLEQEKAVIFDLSGIVDNEDINEIVIGIVINLINQVCSQRKGERKTIIFDEALDQFKTKTGGNFIGGSYRKIRKENGQIFVITQGVDFLDVIDPTVKKSILNNRDIVMLLDHSKAKHLFPAIQKELSLTDFEMELLESIERGEDYREFFLKLGDQTRVFRNDLSPYSLALFETGKDWEEIKRLVKERGSVDAGVRQYVENQFIKRGKNKINSNPQEPINEAK